MNKMLAALAAAGTLVAGVVTAAADTYDQTPVEKMVTKLTYMIDGQHIAKPTWTSTVSDMQGFPEPSLCVDTLRDAKLAPDTKIYSSQGFWFKTAKKDDKGQYILPADVEGLCKRYEDFYVHEFVEAAVMAAWQQQSMIKKPVEGMYESEAQRVGISGRLCAEWVDKALAYGFKADHKVESSRYSMPTTELGKAKELWCQPAIDFEAKRVEEIKNLAAAKHQAIVDVYKKAGIKGKRLELYVSYGMPDNTGFYAAGCGSTVESLPALKKAKKLFVWLEGPQGYTIRKFTFKGDNYTVTERTYSTQEGAYRGCR
jgi:hypothetical protein